MAPRVDITQRADYPIIDIYHLVQIDRSNIDAASMAESPIEDMAVGPALFTDLHREFGRITIVREGTFAGREVNERLGFVFHYGL